MNDLLKKKILVVAGLAIIFGSLAFVGIRAIVAHRRAEAAREWARLHPPLPRRSPFVRIVSVARLVGACRNAFESVLEAPAGWSVDGVRCRPTTLVVRYRRESSSAGTVRDLESALRRSVEMRDNGEAEGSWSLHVPSSSLLLSKIPTLREEEKDLATVLEREGIEEVGSNPPAIAFPLFPDDPGLLTEISSVPGFSATALIWSKGKGWTLKGEWKHAS